ncbi:integrase, catalytic region, zinc finger, CCHC-type containing protein [Tanacetum coccineum]
MATLCYYGDYVIGDNMISRVYYVEGLGHNLFSIGQFCDSDLEVAFRKHSCYVRDTDGVELIKGSRGSNLYTISVKDMMKSSPIYLLSKASKNKSWLWHRHLNHLNFGTVNDLARKDLQNGVVERWNCTLVEAARTMLIFSKASVFLWVEVVATAFFGALCYPTNDNEDLGKLQPTADIGIFVGYAPSRKEPSCVERPVSPALHSNPVQFILYTPLLLPLIMMPFSSHSPSSSSLQSLSLQQGVAAGSTSIKDNPFAPVDNDIGADSYEYHIIKYKTQRKRTYQRIHRGI